MYELVIDKENQTIEVHWDLCDELMAKKDNYELNNKVEYIAFHLFNEVEDFLKREEYKEFEVVECEVCKPFENDYDEEYDDFYEEFDEDDEIDDSRCDIF